MNNSMSLLKGFFTKAEDNRPVLPEAQAMSPAIPPSTVASPPPPIAPVAPAPLPPAAFAEPDAEISLAEAPVPAYTASAPSSASLPFAERLRAHVEASLGAIATRHPPSDAPVGTIGYEQHISQRVGL